MSVIRNPQTLDWNVTFDGHTVVFRTRREAVRFARNNRRTHGV